MIDSRDRQALTEAGEYYRSGDLDRAEALCRRFLKRRKTVADGWQLLGLIAFKKSLFRESIAHYEKAIKLDPSNPRFHYLRAKAHTVQGTLDEAIAGFDAALRLDASFQPAHTWKAVVLERKGDFDGARELMESYVADGREDPEMAETWARLEMREKRYESAIHVLDRQLAKSIPQLTREVMLFLRGKALEAAGQHEEAFAAYRLANDTLEAPFDATAYTRSIDSIIATYSRDALANANSCRDRSTKPLFIAGMPRSGTTLVEQILAAHPDVCGAGEIRDFERIDGDVLNALPPDNAGTRDLTRLTQQVVDRLGARYLNALRKLDRDAAVVTNKSLENYKQLGLIQLLLPGARVIHCHRRPIDTCVSCYCSHLMPPRHSYSADMNHLALVYREYERLMRHWTDVLSIPILEIAYEDVVANQETASRAIIEFAGLEWDDACLRFHEADRVAMTLSYDQVRKPLYNSSVGRAERFGTGLDPLRSALARFDEGDQAE